MLSTFSRTPQDEAEGTCGKSSIFGSISDAGSADLFHQIGSSDNSEVICIFAIKWASDGASFENIDVKSCRVPHVYLVFGVVPVVR